jgi:hypothetical protein
MTIKQIPVSYRVIQGKVYLSKPRLELVLTNFKSLYGLQHAAKVIAISLKPLVFVQKISYGLKSK